MKSRRPEDAATQTPLVKGEGRRRSLLRRGATLGAAIAMLWSTNVATALAHGHHAEQRAVKLARSLADGSDPDQRRESEIVSLAESKDAADRSARSSARL